MSILMKTSIALGTVFLLAGNTMVQARSHFNFSLNVGPQVPYYAPYYAPYVYAPYAAPIYRGPVYQEYYYPQYYSYPQYDYYYPAPTIIERHHYRRHH